MGPDPHTKSMTHTNYVEFARFFIYRSATQNAWGSHKMYCRHTKHTTFFTITVESFVWEEAIRVCTRLLSRVGSHHIMRISMHGASLTLSHMFLIFNLVQLISMRIDDHPESG